MGDKYSEIEIQTAKNLLAKGYEWIARDEDDALYAFKTKPRKGGYAWNYGGGVLLLVDENARGVIPLFDIIRWEDDAPVSIRDIAPQILTDEEREWLRTVVKPFRDRLKTVEAHDGSYYGRYVAFIIAHPEKWREDIGGGDIGLSLSQKTGLRGWWIIKSTRRRSWGCDG